MVVTLDETGVHVLRYPPTAGARQLSTASTSHRLRRSHGRSGRNPGVGRSSIEIRNVRVFQNERPLYDGDSLPQGVRLSGRPPSTLRSV